MWNDLLISIHPPRVGWDDDGAESASNVGISIHPPRVGWDYKADKSTYVYLISIHPPRVGWDTDEMGKLEAQAKFQSTHPVWGGTLRAGVFR